MEIDLNHLLAHYFTAIIENLKFISKQLIFNIIFNMQFSCK